MDLEGRSFVSSVTVSAQFRVFDDRNKVDFGLWCMEGQK